MPTKATTRSSSARIASVCGSAPLRPAQLDDAEKRKPTSHSSPLQLLGLFERSTDATHATTQPDHAPDSPAKRWSRRETSQNSSNTNSTPAHRIAKIIVGRQPCPARYPCQPDRHDKTTASTMTPIAPSGTSDHRLKPEQLTVARLLQARLRPQRGEHDEQDNQHSTPPRKGRAASESAGQHGRPGRRRHADEHALEHLSERRRPRRGGADIASELFLARLVALRRRRARASGLRRGLRVRAKISFAPNMRFFFLHPLRERGCSCPSSCRSGSGDR